MTSQADVQHGQPQAGTMLGQAAIAVDGEFSLADSAEELSLHMAEKTEDKHHAERKVRGDAPLQTISTEAILAYMAQTHDADGQAKLTELARHLLSGKGDPPVTDGVNLMYLSSDPNASVRGLWNNLDIAP